MQDRMANRVDRTERQHGFSDTMRLVHVNVFLHFSAKCHLRFLNMSC